MPSPISALMTRIFTPKQTADLPGLIFWKATPSLQAWMQEDGTGSLLTVQLLCFNAEAWHWQSHTSAVLLSPCCVCWSPASTCNLLTLLSTRVCWAHQAHECDREVDGEKRTKLGSNFLWRKDFTSQPSFWQLTY